MNDKYIVYFISRTKKKIMTFIEKELQKEGLNDLIPSCGNILTVLYENNSPLSMKEISKLIGKDKSTVTFLINKLLELEYIEKFKNDNDKRKLNIVLTNKGKKLRKKFDKISKNVYNTAYKNFTIEEKEQFLYLLKKLNNNFS